MTSQISSPRKLIITGPVRKVRISEVVSYRSCAAGLKPLHPHSKKRLFSGVKPKFHYIDFPVTSATSPRQTRDVPFSPNSITATSPKLPRTGTSRVLRHAEVGVVEFGLKLSYVYRNYPNP